jgi:hypothetical protein
MNKKSNLIQGFVGALILATTLLPAAALARDGEDSGATLPVNISTHIESEDSGDGVSSNSTTTATLQDEGENSDNNNQGEEASSTSRHNEGEHQSIKSGHESDVNDNEIEIDQESADTATTTIDAPEHVSNHGELRSFLNHIVKEDSRISDVHVSSSTIETHYEMPAKFLWAIPTNLTADVTVNSDGSVTVTYPWYAFLFAKHDSNLTAQLQQSATSTGTTTLSASVQAHLLNLLFSSLKTSSEQ